MPTGYTAALLDGDETPEEFMFKSLRGMGVAVMQRDESLDAPVKRREVSDYRYKSLKDAQQALEDWSNSSEDQRRAIYNELAEHNAKLKAKAQQTYEEESQRINAAFDLIRSKKFDEELMGWKNFMVEQLRMSEPYPVKDEHYDLPPFEEWQQSREISLLRDVEYYAGALKEEIERVQSANEWLDKALAVLGKTID